MMKDVEPLKEEDLEQDKVNSLPSVQRVGPFPDGCPRPALHGGGSQVLSDMLQIIERLSIHGHVFI